MAELIDNLSFTLTSIVDILLVAIFVYYLLYLLKGTRSGRVALGNVNMIKLYFISDR